MATSPHCMISAHTGLRNFLRKGFARTGCWRTGARKNGEVRPCRNVSDGRCLGIVCVRYQFTYGADKLERMGLGQELCIDGEMRSSGVGGVMVRTYKQYPEIPQK